MQLQQRRNFFVVFAIFFIICTPFIILYSTGFNVDFKNTEISKSLTVKTDTIPRDASLLVNNKPIANTPFELNTSNTAPVNIQIQKKGFLDEKFLVLGDTTQNSYVDLTNLWLLPDTTTNVSSSSNLSEISQKTKQVISENQAMVEYLNKGKLTLGIIDFGIGGQVEQIQPITNTQVIGGKGFLEYELNDQTKIKLLQQDGEYKKFGNDIFYKNNILLIRKNGYWLAKDLDKINPKIKDISRINTSNLVVLDQDKSLWIYNIDTDQAKFLDTGFSKMMTLGSPSTIWIWRNDTVYRLEPADMLVENLSLSKYEFLKNYTVESQIGGTLNVQSLYQGIAIQTGKYLFYLPDFKKNKWQVLATNIQSMTTNSESVFWLDNDKNLFVNNLSTNKTKVVLNNVKLTKNIYYSEYWKRIMLYYPTEVDSVWYNKDINNFSIKTYYNKNWINNQLCFPKIIDQVQFCIKGEELKIYKNNNLF